QRLSFAGRHFRDSTAMQNDSAEQLHIKMYHVPRHRLITDRETMTSLFQAAGGALHGRERLRQNFAEMSQLFFRIRNSRELLLPGCRFCAQSVVREVLELLVELVDSAHHRRQPPELALIF